MYAKLRDRVTSSGYTIDDVIQVGVDNPGSPSRQYFGVSAGDEESYKVNRIQVDRGTIVSCICLDFSRTLWSTSTWKVWSQSRWTSTTRYRLFETSLSIWEWFKRWSEQIHFVVENSNHTKFVGLYISNVQYSSRATTNWEEIQSNIWSIQQDWTVVQWRFSSFVNHQRTFTRETKQCKHK